jgi:hypothetical protein
MTEQEIHVLIRELQKSPLALLSDMQSRTVFAYLIQLGYEIIPPRVRHLQD